MYQKNKQFIHCINEVGQMSGRGFGWFGHQWDRHISMNEWMNRCVYRWMMNAWTNDWRNREIQSNNTALKAFVANLKSTGTSQIETLVLEKM